MRDPTSKPPTVQGHDGRNHVMTTGSLESADRQRLDEIGYPYLSTLHDPYPLMAELREAASAYRIPGSWMVTSYEQVNRVLRDARTWLSSHLAFANAQTQPYIIDPNEGPWFRAYSAMLAFADGEQHRRLRKLVAPLFTPHGVEQFRVAVREAITQQLDDALAGADGAMDLKRDFAFPMPTRVILDILGFPQEEAYRFYEITDLIVPPAPHGTPEEWFEHANATYERHVGYVLGEAEKRRQSGGSDLLARVAAKSENGDRLNDVELAGTVFFFIAAGYETTASTLTNGVYHLMNHPEQFQMLREDRSLVPSAVEEILRYEGPVRNASPRFASADTEIDGQRINKGEMVWPLVAAANRDPAVFPDPDTFDITRTPNEHLAFAVGPHYCLGRPLARMELQVGLEALIDGLPETLELAGPVEWEDSLVTRKLSALPVRW